MIFIHSRLFYLLLLFFKNAKCREHRAHSQTSSVLRTRLHPFDSITQHVSGNATLVFGAKPQPRTLAAYFLPQALTTSRPTHEIAKYRQEGNFYQAQPFSAAQPIKSESINRQITSYYVKPPVDYNHHVVHTEHWTTEIPHYYEPEYRPRRYTDAITPQSIENASKLLSDLQNDEHVTKSITRKPQLDQPLTRDAAYQDQQSDKVVENAKDADVHETRSSHDIFMRLAGPHKRNLFGHVENGPKLFEKRFESQNRGNRFRGQVLWADKSGGYGEHHWDLAQGKL